MKKIRKYIGLIIVCIFCTLNICGCNLDLVSVTDGILSQTAEHGSSAGFGAPTEPVLEDDVDTGSFSIHFIDVGQGDATLIIGTDGSGLLFDCGNNGYEESVKQYLSDNLPGGSVGHLSYVCISHFDSDHYGTLEEILEETSFVDYRTTFLGFWDDSNETVTYKYTKLAFSDLGYSLNPVKVGDELWLGDVKVTVIAPNRDSISDYAGSENNFCIALLVEYGDNRVMLSADCEEEAERDIVGSGIDISGIDIYKVGHHGSYSSSSDAFLNAMGLNSDSVAIISCGAGNDYGHPHDVVLNRLSERGVTVLRTDIMGSMVFVGDGVSFLRR